MLLDAMTQYNVLVLSKLIYRFQSIPTKIPEILEIDKEIPRCR